MTIIAPASECDNYDVNSISADNFDVIRHDHYAIAVYSLSLSSLTKLQSSLQISLLYYSFIPSCRNVG